MDVFGMEDFDYAQIQSKFIQQNLFESVAVSPAPTALIESII